MPVQGVDNGNNSSAATSQKDNSVRGRGITREGLPNSIHRGQGPKYYGGVGLVMTENFKAGDFNDESNHNGTGFNGYVQCDINDRFAAGAKFTQSYMNILSNVQEKSSNCFEGYLGANSMGLIGDSKNYMTWNAGLGYLKIRSRNYYDGANESKDSSTLVFKTGFSINVNISQDLGIVLDVKRCYPKINNSFFGNGYTEISGGIKFSIGNVK